MEWADDYAPGGDYASDDPADYATDTPRRFLFIVGAAKAGTTSLIRWLSGSPGFAMHATKEPKFFVRARWRHYRTGEWRIPRYARKADYLASFRAETPEDWHVDASVDYLWRDGCAERIHAFGLHHEVRLVCILRDPVSRAFSEYNHTVRHGAETLPFREALAQEPRRLEEGWDPLFLHARRSRYHDDVARYRALFGDRLLLLDFEDLREPQSAATRVCAHLGIPYRGEAAALTARNTGLVERRTPVSRTIGAVTRVRALRRGLRRVMPRRLQDRLGGAVRAFTHARPEMSEADRLALFERIADDAARCLADPEMPTASWHTTRRLLQASPAAAGVA